MRDLDILNGELKRERRHLLRRALAEACHWSRASSGAMQKPSDQYWIECFRKNEVSEADVRKFLTVYRLVRAKWIDSGVAGEVRALRRKDWEPTKGIPALATALATHIRPSEKPEAETTPDQANYEQLDGDPESQDGQRTSAASKIAMFTHYDKRVFIWDSLALSAIKLRQWAFHHREKAGRVSSRFPRSYFSKGRPDYKTFYEHCTREFDFEAADKGFADAVGDFSDYVASTGGPMSAVVGPDFYARRLFDKLLVCEGERIREWLAATKATKTGLYTDKRTAAASAS